MRIYTLLTVFLVSILLNGCIVDRIKQRLAVEKQLETQTQTASVKNQNLGTEASTVKQTYVVAKKVVAKRKVKTYKPSKPTAPIYANPQQTEVKTAKPKAVVKHKAVVKKVKKKSSKVSKSKVVKKVKHKRKHRVKKVVPEPYSIKKNESDPELLGPQTTLDSNPLSENKVEKKTTKATKG